MNRRNSPKPGDFLIVPSSSHSCEYYLEYKKENQFEWDESKNRKNIEKHKISFECIYDLFHDKNMLQTIEQPHKWEDLSKLDASVEKNEGNMDPIRGKLVGDIDGKLYTAIYTLRDEIGKMRYRIISLRRAKKNEIKFYNSIKLKREMQGQG